MAAADKKGFADFGVNEGVRVWDCERDELGFQFHFELSSYFSDF